MPHDNVRTIDNLIQRDSETADIVNKSFNKTVKFHSLDQKLSTQTSIWKNAFRPFISEQWNTRKIIATIRDEKVFLDIQGDNKIFFLMWKDSLEGKIDMNFIKSKITDFKERNYAELVKIKEEL